MMTLYRKELGRVLTSVIFLLMAAGTVLFAYTQDVFPQHEIIQKPEPGRFYGMKNSNDPALIMPEAAESLFARYSANNYVTYPTGFYKAVKLNQTNRVKMGKIIAELSVNGNSGITQESNGTADSEKHEIQISGDSLQPNADGAFQIIMPDRGAEGVPDEFSGFHLNPDITWERFSELMKQADKLLGGGSDYSVTWISHRFGTVPVSYEEALADYGLTVSHDKMTGAYARLFSDYMGIILGLLPVFPAVFLCLRDRKNISPMLHTRRISSARFILTRFFALATATILPVLLMGMIMTGIHAADYGLINIDVLAYFKYTFFWIFPTAIAAIGVGLLFTTLTNTPVAIAVQLIWWFADAMSGSGAFSFYGVRPLQLIPRHNGLGKTGAYIDYLPNLIQNRILVTLIAVLLVAVTVCVFSAKRRGLLYVPVFKRGKIQSEV
jgi:hypothetical protein